MSINLSLDRIRKLQALLSPYTRPTCHITGTNGKGSVSALLSSIFLASSASVVGRFNSPHLVSIHDSITLNNVPVSPQVYAGARAHVERIDLSHGIGASSFELLTCTALHIFEQARADIVILEVGMGGRLDATNVIPDEAVLVSALTSVDLDHQAFLGGSVAAIAHEKAAIARRGKPFVLGKQTYEEVELVVREVAEQVSGQIIHAPVVTEREWDEGIDGPKPLESTSFQPPFPQPVEASVPCFSQPLRALLPLLGEHQLANLGTALGIVSTLLTNHSYADHIPWRECMTVETVSRGIQTTFWPGRLSFHKLSSVLVLADGAHNPASARALAAYISSLLSSRKLAPSDTPLTFLVGLSHSPPKSPVDVLTPLMSLSARIGVAMLQFTPPEGMPWVVSEPIDALRDTILKVAPNAEVWQPNEVECEQPIDGLRAALDWAVERQRLAATDGLVVVTGSLYLVADFYRLAQSEQHIDAP